MVRAILDGRARRDLWQPLHERGPASESVVGAAYLGGRSLSLVMLACTGHYLTDTVTALKLFPTNACCQSLRLETTGFETDHEITAKVLARRASDRRSAGADITREARRKARRSALRDWFIGARTFWRYRNG